LKISIIILVFNRPHHTKILLNALNSKKKILEISLYMDGATNVNDKKAQDEILKITNAFDNLKIKTNKQKYNLRLKKSIFNAIDTELIDSDAVIIIEDDCLPLDGFFEFMYWGLKKFESDANVMSINGYQIPSISSDPNSTKRPYFGQRFIPWGWATWKDRWINYPKTNESYLKLLEMAKELNNIPQSLRSLLFETSLIDKSDVWSCGWILAHYSLNKLVLQPPKSLIRNIGFDGSGIHSFKTDEFDIKYINQEVNHRWIDSLKAFSEIEIDYNLINQMDNFFSENWGKTITKFKLS
jgi:hypothetical protein